MSLSPIRIVVTGALADPLAGKADQAAVDALEAGKVAKAAPVITGNFNANDHTIYNLADPVGDNDAVPRDWFYGQLNSAIAAANAAAIGTDYLRGLLATSTLTAAAPFRVAIGAASTDAATASVAGLLSAADKVKLNGIATGAQVNTVASVAGRTGIVALAKGDVGLGNVDNTADLAKPISTAVQTALNGKAGTANATASAAGLLAAADKAKLDGVAAGATANAPDASLKDRANHTGAQGIGTVTGLQAALDGKAPNANATAAVAGKMSAADKAKLDGIAAGATGDMTAGQIKSAYEGNADTNAYTDAERAKLAGVAAGAQVNAVASVAGRTGSVTLARGDVGLGNVDNTADAGKPVSAAMQAALDGKAATAVTAGLDTRLAAAETALPGKASVTAPIQTQGKPGDVPDRFTATLNGAAATGAAPTGALVETDDMGAALRQSGASLTALRERIAVWPDRVIRLRARVQRATAPTDPAGDTVRFAVNRLTKAKGTISTPTVIADVNLAVLPDPTVIEAVFAASAGAGVDFTWTATTRYLVPFVQTFGADGVTDIGEIAWEDITDGLAIGQDLAAEEAARIAAFGAEQAARIANDDAEQAARIAAVAAEADARGAAVTVLQGNIDANGTAIGAAQADARNEKLRARRIERDGLGQNVEDVETLAIRDGRRAMGVDAAGRLLALGLDSKWADGLDGEHRLAIVGDGELTSFALNRDGTIFLVPDEATKAQLGGAVAAIDVPHGLFDRDVFGAAYLSPTLIRAFSQEEGQTYAYVYRRDRAPQAAIREGREPIEGIDSNGQSLEVGGGANAADPHVLTTAPRGRHLNLSLDDGLRGPGSTAWNPAAASDFVPAVEAYNAAKNEGETGQAATMRWLSARQVATGRIQTPFVARADGRGGTLLADLVKGSVPYANALAALRRMGEIACEKYRRPFVVRCTPFGQGNADRASATPRQDWVDMLVDYAADNSADVLALLGDLAAAYPDLYADVALPTRIPLITAQLTDAISATGDTADDIIFAHVDAAEASDLIFISHPQYFFRDSFGYVDAAHLQALGYCVKGEYHAQAYERVIWNGEAVGGLLPDRANIVRSGGDIVVPVLGAVGTLRLNTTDLPAAAGWGFDWSGAGSVTGVTFAGGNIVVAGTSGSGRLTYGARHQASARPAGSYSYGNVCDSNPADSLAVPGLKLTNWLPAFDKTL